MIENSAELRARLNDLPDAGVLAVLGPPMDGADAPLRARAMRVLGDLAADRPASHSLVARAAATVKGRADPAEVVELLLAFSGGAGAERSCALVAAVLAGIEDDDARAVALSLLPSERGTNAGKEAFAVLMSEWRRLGADRLGSCEGGAKVRHADKALVRITLAWAEDETELIELYALVRLWSPSRWRDQVLTQVAESTASE